MTHAVIVNTTPNMAATALPAGPAFLPEAPVSLSIKLMLPDLSHDPVSITARGMTGIEAAHNLREAITALRTPPVPPTPTREEALAKLLACGLSKAVAKGDNELIDRLLKGAALVLANAVEPGNREGTWAVRSQRDSATWYEVEGTRDGLRCTCPNARTHQSDQVQYYCKHSLAALFVMKMQPTA